MVEFWRLVEPVQCAPYCTALSDTHVLCEDEKGQAWWVSRQVLFEQIIRKVKPMRSPQVWSLQSLIKSASEARAGLKDGSWVPARPYAYATIGQRVRAAWLVFTGNADAVVWGDDYG